MQVRYYPAPNFTPPRSFQLTGIAAIAAVLWLWSRNSSFPAVFKGATFAFFAIAALGGLIRSRHNEPRQRADRGRLLLDFRNESFLYYRTSNDTPEEISYAEILTYYVEQGRNDEYDRPQKFLTIEFRKRQLIALNVKTLDIDPQQIVSFIEHQMERV